MKREGNKHKKIWKKNNLKMSENLISYNFPIFKRKVVNEVPRKRIVRQIRMIHRSLELLNRLWRN